MLPGLARTCPLSISFLWTPRRRAPMLSPAWASSNSLRNISIPVTTTLRVSSFRPTISTSSDTWRVPASTLPVATVPRPVIENTSSTGMMKFLSVSRSGSGMKLSTASISSMILSPHGPFGSSRAFRAEPLMIGQSVKSYSSNCSTISISTNSSNSSSSTMSHLFMNTTMYGTLTWRDRRMCSFVWAITPSVAATTKIAPSIWAAPVIMFLT